MKKLYIVAALLMASTAAHAGNSISFEIDGHKVRIEAPRNCDQLSCIQISAPGLSGSGLNFKSFKSSNSADDDNSTANSNPPAQPTAPVAQAPAPQPRAAGTNVAVTSAASAAPAALASTSPTPVAGFDAPATQASTVVSTPAPQPAPVAAAPAPTTPLGVWATEENKGNVRIESCGSDLCGYAENSGEKILINMKPSDNKWTGRIHNPDDGGNYDSTIAMKGPNTLKVQGCAFGGMFCGGQTWKRVS
jgi:uncharacterized protein (DUF2147 family)